VGLHVTSTKDAYIQNDSFNNTIKIISQKSAIYFNFANLSTRLQLLPYGDSTLFFLHDGTWNNISM
jgi:hypothetical protein